jgi:hypothetical protein
MRRKFSVVSSRLSVLSSQLSVVSKRVGGGAKLRLSRGAAGNSYWSPGGTDWLNTTAQNQRNILEFLEANRIVPDSATPELLQLLNSFFSTFLPANVFRRQDYAGRRLLPQEWQRESPRLSDPRREIALPKKALGKPTYA